MERARRDLKRAPAETAGDARYRNVARLDQYEGDGALEIAEGDPRDWDDPRPAWEDEDEPREGEGR